MIGAASRGGNAGRSSPLLDALAIALPLLIAAIVFFWGVYYVLETTTPTIKSDAWYFVDAWLIPWQDGSFTLADLWAKRHGNHAQPLAAILFLANAHWLGLDFTIETLLALLLAAGFAAGLVVLARTHAPHRTPLELAWFAAAVICVVFSINAKDKLSWSIVGLFYIGHCLGLAFLLLVASLRERRSRWVLPALSLLLCALLDTTGILWCCAAIGVLLLDAVATRPRRWRTPMASAMGIAAAIAIYLMLYKLLAPIPDGYPTSPSLDAFEGLAHLPEALWHLTSPFGAALAHPDRLASTWPRIAGPVTVALTLLVLAAHAWIWWGILSGRGSPGRSSFVAAGFALYAYACIAGVVVQRVPEHGWSYLLQPRYGVFYDYLALAPLLAWFCASPGPGIRSRRRRTLPLLGCMLPCMFALSWIKTGWLELPWIKDYNDKIARDTWSLLLDPATLPADCNPFVSLCGLTAQDRATLVRAVRVGELNLSSPWFRMRHGLSWIENPVAYRPEPLPSHSEIRER